MKTSNRRESILHVATRRFAKRALAVSALLGLVAAGQAQDTYTPVFSNVWFVAAGAYPDLPTNGNNVRGIAISPVTTNVLYFSSTGGTNGGNSHVATVAFASGSNYLANLNSTGVSGGTVGTEGVRVADDGTVYGINLSGAPNSTFNIYKWPSDTDVTTPPTIVFQALPSSANSFQWRIGDYMDLRGSGANTEIVVVGNGSGANITTNFVIFRPTDASCTAFTNFSITVPGSSAAINLCGGGVAFEGTNNAIWIRRSGSQETRRVSYNPATLTAVVTRTNNVDQSVCQGLKYYASTNGVQLLATVQSAASGATPVQYARVFNVSASGNSGTLVSVLTQSISAYTNGNSLGNVDIQQGYFVFGAPNNGISLYKLDFVTQSPPSVSASASATTIIGGYPVTFTAAASGSKPLSYQWYFNTNTAISGATTNVYTIASVDPTNAGVYTLITTNLYGAATNSLTIGVIPNGSSLLATQLWSLAPGSRDYLTTSDTQRGLAFDRVTQRLVLVSRSSTNGIHLLNAATGADAGVLDISSLLAITPPGTYAINMCGVADDGIVYVGNLLTSATSDNFVIYSWSAADPSAYINQAYGGNPGIGRIGDTMAVRGSGTNTEILCSFRTGTNVALFNTADGYNFNFNLIAVTNLPAGAQANGFAGLGLAFGPGKTFYARSPGFDLRQVGYDVGSGTGWVINDYTNVPVLDSAIGVDNGNAYCAGITVSASPQSLALYDLAAPGGPNVVDREFFPVNNANGNGTGAVAVDAARGRIFALDSNSGIIALSYAGKLAITPTPGGQVLAWPTTNSVLQSSGNVAGPYADVTGAANPYTNNAAGTQFFRLRK